MSMALTNGNHNGALQMMPDRETRDRLLANAIMNGGTREQVELVVSICDMYGLEPLLKHLVLIKGVPYITRDGLLHVAHRSGKFDGIEVELKQLADGEWAATCTVWRKDLGRAIRYTAYEKEHKPKDASRSAWGQYPRAMLSKCFDEETEVLTTHGFERFGNVWGQVLQVTERGLEPTDATPFVQDYAGPMVTLDSDDLNFCVTPNHDMLTTTGKIEAGEMYEKSRARPVYRIPRLVKGSKTDAPISDEMIQLAAAYLADGNDTSGTGFAISVSRPRKIAHLERLGGYHARDTQATAGQQSHTATRTITTLADKERFLYDRSLVSYLCAPNKCVRIENLLTLSGEQASLFVASLLFHDGHQQAKSGVRRFYTSREDHAEAFELAAVMGGYSVSNRKARMSDIATKPNYSITVSERDAIAVCRIGRAYKDKQGAETTKGLHLTQNASGRVWCVTVPSGVIVVRRRGFSMLCGNCAEVMALRRAFDVSMPAAEEVGYDGQNAQSSIGQVIEVSEGRVVYEETPAPAPLPEPTPMVKLKVEDWPDERLLAALGQGKTEAQVRRLLTVYLGRGTDKETLTDRAHAAKAAAAALNDEQLAQYKALLKELAIARATAIGIPPKVTQPEPPPADDLTAVVGEPEGDPKAKLIRLAFETGATRGWDEARVRKFGAQLYQSDNMERWSISQLDTFAAWLRDEKHNQAAG